MPSPKPTPPPELKRLLQSLEEANDNYLRTVAHVCLLQPCARHGWKLSWGMGGVFIHDSEGKGITNTHSAQALFAEAATYQPSFLGQAAPRSSDLMALRTWHNNIAWDLVSTISTSSD
jgi:hypothetical protein